MSNGGCDENGEYCIFLDVMGKTVAVIRVSSSGRQLNTTITAALTTSLALPIKHGYFIIHYRS